MEFTYRAYENLVRLLWSHGYEINGYHDWETAERSVILRHDIDYEPRKAVELARLEHRIGARSTYFVLLTSEFYNVFSGGCFRCIEEIAACGHTVGLHFDEVRYPELAGKADAVCEKILAECRALESATGIEITTVSMHRPSKAILEADLQIPGIVNSYGNVFFREFKYLSDSRRRWREQVEDIICSEQYPRLHILTHAFWYENEEKNIHDSIYAFVNRANAERYDVLSENITDIGSIMDNNEIAGVDLNETD